MKIYLAKLLNLFFWIVLSKPLKFITYPFYKLHLYIMYNFVPPHYMTKKMHQKQLDNYNKFVDMPDKIDND